VMRFPSPAPENKHLGSGFIFHIFQIVENQCLFSEKRRWHLSESS
jgi:hypothetical protein